MIGGTRMKLRRFLDLRPPLFVIGILLIMGRKSVV